MSLSFKYIWSRKKFVSYRVSYTKQVTIETNLLMKHVLLIFTSTILISITSFAQKWNQEIICSSDTLTVEPHLSKKYNQWVKDSVNQKPYKIVYCHTRSNVGFRMDFAVSNYYYGDKTSSWIGQHGGPNFNFILTISKLNFGFRFKPWTLSPKKELIFNGLTLPTTANLNNIRLDYYVGYSIDFDKLISLEPYIGYNRTSFHGVNNDLTVRNFSFNNTGGLIVGTTLNKYFHLKNYGYISVFGTLGYGFVDYKSVHPELDNGYLEWNIGIALKSFGVKHYSKRVE